MNFKHEMLHFVVCPQCQGDLKYTKEQVLICVQCRLCYPVEEGVPDLSLEAAIPLSPDGQLAPRPKTSYFTVEKGENTGMHFHLEPSTCRAIGRRLEDSLQTQVFNVDFTMTLDDHTKKLIANCLSKSGGKKKKKPSANKGGSDLGAFKRLPDIILDDTAASRLHAMVFFDESGDAGILDLVSKNGTFVNGREVETYMLQPGDEISIGSTKIKFSIK